MNRLIRIFVYSVVAFLGVAVPALADKIPIVLDTVDLEQKDELSFQLPEGSFDCSGSAKGTSTTVKLPVAKLYDSEGVRIRTTQVEGDCTQARDDSVILAYLNLGLKSAKLSLGAEKNWALLVEFEQPLPSDGRLDRLLRASVGGRRGIALTDPVCDQHSCKFIGEDADQLLNKLPRFAGAQVSALHGDEFSSALTKDGTRVSPKLVDIEWVVPRSVIADVRVIDPIATDESFVIENRAYRIFMKMGIVDCKTKEQGRVIKSCATVSRGPENDYKIEITDAGAIRTLRDQESLEVLIPAEAGLAVEEDGTSVPSFAIDVSFKTCKYEIQQEKDSRVFRGMLWMKTSLRISEVNNTPGCDATDGWKIKSAAPNDLEVIGELTAVKDTLYVIEVKTSMGRSSSVELQFFRENGLRIETTSRVNVYLKERKSFASFNIHVYSGNKCVNRGTKLTNVSKKNQALARGHANVFAFDDVSGDDLVGWVIDPTSDPLSAQRAIEDFCIDSIAESADQTQIRFVYKRGNDELGEAKEELTLKQHDFAVKQSLPSWARLVCEDSIADSNRTVTIANKAGSLRRCNLVFELEAGAFEALTGAYPRYSAKGRPTTKLKVKDEDKDKLMPDACGNGDDDENAEADYKSFIASWGEQELVLKLWSPGDDGEFVTVNGDDGTTIHLGATVKNIDAGPYQIKIVNKVLAICVDLTYGGAIGNDAYEVVKLSVEYSDDHYAADWNRGGFDAPFEAKRRRMPVLGWKHKGSAFGPRLYFSLAVPTLIRVPGLGINEKQSSDFRRASLIAFEAGVLVGLEWWNFDENKPVIPAMAPQLYVGCMFLGIPTQDNPRVLRPSGVIGAGFRIPTGAPTTSPVQGLTSLVVWAEITESARQTVAVSALLGFKVELAVFGG